MSNNLNKIYLMILLIILTTSCSSFEKHRQFSYKMLANPDSLERIYINSEFRDSLFEANDMDYFFSAKAKQVMKKYFSDGNYNIYKEKHYSPQITQDGNTETITLYKLTLESPKQEFYITFVFEKINNKWILVSIPMGTSLDPVL